MTENEFIKTLAPLVTEVTGKAFSQEELDVTFGDLEIESLDQIEIISHIEEKFNCQIEESALREIRTPRALLEHISDFPTAT
ncbi:acyl carrier protein [Nocardiopsis kunsanensis]|uniref:acyl carrier protein n=1 Tax=Nocardiopsis kunsanensis TaxID=141693 RepID=UPI0009FE313A|nr:acyl carrier protein [Nocardiopsis kunsanensis]